MKVIFCLPGRSFSKEWLNSWMDTLSVLSANQIQWAYSVAYDPVVYYARSRVLGGNNIDGKFQKPFRGQLEYDYQFWIDSDMVWTGEQVLKLLRADKPIISGCYMMADNTQCPIVENLDYNHLFEQGSFKFLTRDDISNRISPFKVSYVGFGFMAIKYGIMESLEYPWFRPKFVEHENFCEFTAEDVGFCWTAQEMCNEIWVDPTVKVGHQKTIELMP